MSDEIQERLSEVERKANGLVDVCAAVADDTLRMCFVLDELHRAGFLPELPWNVATVLVELHHAMRAANEGLEDEEGIPASQRVEELRKEILELRRAYAATVKGGNLEARLTE
jgi:hypothetical protein